MIDYLGVVLWDIVVANFHVSRLILFPRNSALRPHWLVVPLELNSAEAITTLAATIRLTPGPVSADVSPDGAFHLVHALDTRDAEAAAALLLQDLKGVVSDNSVSVRLELGGYPK